MYKLFIIITCLIATSFAGKDCSSCQEKGKDEQVQKIQERLDFIKKIKQLKKDGKKDEAKKLIEEKIEQLKKDGKTKEASRLQKLLNRKDSIKVPTSTRKNTITIR